MSERRRSPTASPAVRVELLGPLGARSVARGEASLPGGRARTLLACLAVRRGPTPADVLVDDLWPADAPRSPRHALENHVSRLRGSLRGVHPGDVVLHCADGYGLSGVTTDAEDLEALITGGEAAARSGDPWGASSRLRRAGDLWRGEPFHGLPPSHLFTVVAARLCELRRRGRDALFDAELAIGLHDDLIDELRSDVVDDPLDERRRGQLMLALYRADRPAGALQAYHEGVDQLRGELGVDPSPELQRLYVAVLRQDVPPTARPVRPSRPAAAPVPTIASRRRRVLPQPAGRHTQFLHPQSTG